MKKVIVCINHRSNPNNPSCGARGGVEIASTIEQVISSEQLNIQLERFKCLGLCQKGPNLRLAPDGQFFYGVCKENIEEVVSALREFAIS